jgi:hypothetical protein
MLGRDERVAWGEAFWRSGINKNAKGNQGNFNLAVDSGRPSGMCRDKNSNYGKHLFASYRNKRDSSSPPKIATIQHVAGPNARDAERLLANRYAPQTALAVRERCVACVATVANPYDAPPSYVVKLPDEACEVGPNKTFKRDGAGFERGGLKRVANEEEALMRCFAFVREKPDMLFRFETLPPSLPFR